MPNASRGVAYSFWLEVEQQRRELGWTKLELAKRSGVARTTIDRLESGIRPPALKTVHDLADALSIDRKHAEKLAGLVPDTPPAGDPRQIDVREAIQASTVYTARQKTMLLDMIDTIDLANGIAPTSEPEH